MQSTVTADTIRSWLHASASEEHRAGLTRYGIPNTHALGVPMGVMKAKAKTLGRRHDVALALWPAGTYEARTMAVFLAEPARMDAATMDRWCADFDSWAICDTTCFHLFDRTAHAWEKVAVWAKDDREFVRRAAFALIWGLSVHDRRADDERFRNALTIAAANADDPRPLVRKAIDMAIRATGKRNAALNQAASETASTLANSSDKSARWIGSHALKELESSRVREKVSART